MTNILLTKAFSICFMLAIISIGPVLIGIEFFKRKPYVNVKKGVPY